MLVLNPAACGSCNTQPTLQLKRERNGCVNESSARFHWQTGAPETVLH